MLSRDALQVVAAVFNSPQLNLPTAAARLIVEIQEWSEEELKAMPEPKQNHKSRLPKEPVRADG